MTARFFKTQRKSARHRPHQQLFALWSSLRFGGSTGRAGDAPAKTQEEPRSIG